MLDRRSGADRRLTSSPGAEAEDALRIFLSSVVGGLEAHRDAAGEAARNLGHEVVRSEDFPAVADAPRRACLAAARGADVVILILGGRYGALQASGLSATHEEYREARDHTDVLAFVSAGVEPEPGQQAFLDEARSWETGGITASFATPEDLRAKVTRALHDHELARAVGPVDEEDLIRRAEAAIPVRGRGSGQGPILHVVISGGPRREILRPGEIEDRGLTEALMGKALLGEGAVLDTRVGTHPRIAGAALLLEQEHGFVSLDQLGTIRIDQPAQRERDRSILEVSALIDEDVRERLLRALGFAVWALDRVDPLRRLTDVAPLAAISGAGYLPWRTRAEQERSPTSGTIATGHSGGVVARLRPARRHRAALGNQAPRFAEDLTVLLRRGIQGGQAL